MDQHLRDEILQANITLHKQEAALYDRIHPELTNREERDRLRRFLDFTQKELGNTIALQALDIGTGTGFVSQELLKRGFTVEAVDISQEMIERLRRKEPDALNEGRLKTIVQDVDTFFAKERKTYDLITASSVLHHFPDYSATIQAMAAHLKPGGHLLFFHEPRRGDASKLEHLLRKIDWKLSRFFLLSREDLRQMKQLNLQYEMADYHVTHGFDEDLVQGILHKMGMEILQLERYSTAQTGLMRQIFYWFFPAHTWSLLARPRRSSSG